jgi:peptidoglycan L-alanyl-D-glutamate endopeptidase CwlK
MSSGPPYAFGEGSLKELQTLDYRLQKVLLEAIKICDFTILEGHRSKERQEDMYKKGLSNSKPGDGKHEPFPSLAVDIAPFPIDFEYLPQYYFLAGVILGIARQLNIKMRFGGDWDMDGHMKPKSKVLADLGHFELMEGS